MAPRVLPKNDDESMSYELTLLQNKVIYNNFKMVINYFILLLLFY